MCILFCLVVFALVGSLAQADTSSSYDMVNHKSYGNCRTWTQKDMMTDDVSHHFECKEETFSDLSSVALSSWSGKRLEVRISKGIMFHLDDRISVALRIDTGPVIKRFAYWDKKNYAGIIEDHTLASGLMEDLAKGQRAVIQVGDERGNIKLRGSDAALKDFRRRVGLQPQQTLDIPSH